MHPIENPFTDADRLLDEGADPLPPVRVVDFHCEVTSEKNAFGIHLDGRVSAVVGTHTHVPTGRRADPAEGDRVPERPGDDRAALPVIGFDPATVLPRFMNGLPTRFEVGGWPVVFNALQIDVDPATGRAARDRAPAAGPGARLMPRDRRAPEGGRLVPSTPSRADLHAHTSRSDGLLLPAELVAAAAAAGVRTLAVADHDTLAGYRELVARGGAAASRAGRAPGRRDQRHRRRRSRTSGTTSSTSSASGWTPTTTRSRRSSTAQRGARRLRFERMVARLRETGHCDRRGRSPASSRADDDALGRPTIARALDRRRACRDRVEDAFARWIGRGMPGYVRREGIGPLEAIAAIRDAGGLPVLAHFAEAPRRAGSHRAS